MRCVTLPPRAPRLSIGAGSGDDGAGSGLHASLYKFLPSKKRGRIQVFSPGRVDTRDVTPAARALVGGLVN